MTEQKRKAPEGANQETYIKDTTKYKVLSMLTNTPQERKLLAQAVGVSDRTLRETVRALRLEGNPIASDSRGRGYWLGNKAETEKTANELCSRAYDLLRTAKALRGINPDQITLEEFMKM